MKTIMSKNVSQAKPSIVKVNTKDTEIKNILMGPCHCSN